MNIHLAKASKPVFSPSNTFHKYLISIISIIKQRSSTHSWLQPEKGFVCDFKVMVCYVVWWFYKILLCVSLARFLVIQRGSKEGPLMSKPSRTSRWHNFQPEVSPLHTVRFRSEAQLQNWLHLIRRQLPLLTQLAAFEILNSWAKLTARLLENPKYSLFIIGKF